jgi:hypothetical protein
MKANLLIFLLLHRWLYHASALIIEGDNANVQSTNIFGDDAESAELTLILPSPIITDGISFCGNGLCDIDEEALSCPSDCSSLELTTSEVSGDMASVGLVFAIKAFRDVIITSIDIFTQSTATKELVQLYIHAGEYLRSDVPGEEWELIYDSPALELLGTYNPTTLNDLNVSINAGMVKSFLLYSPNMIRCMEGTNDQRLVWASDNMMEIYEGVGLSNKFTNAGLISSELSRTFTGTIR